MPECNPQLLSAYIDDELLPIDRERLLTHIRQCPACRSELELLMAMSGSLRDYQFDDLKADELQQLHEAIDESADQPVWRIGLALTAMAASILIVGFAWLAALPATSQSPTTIAVQPSAPWEQMAMTLRPGAMPQANDTDIRVARADFADWMLQGLTGQR